MNPKFRTIFDKDQRYQLVRGTDKKVICFLMLNPSYAGYDEKEGVHQHKY